jgi:ferredoxin
MRSALIVGSGPAAAGVALALSRCSNLSISVIDLGLQLENRQRIVQDRLAANAPVQWDETDIDVISASSIGPKVGGLREKTAFGSDFAFRDIGQLAQVVTLPGVHDRLISAAFGGFSNVWGSQVLPFSAATFDQWPIPLADLEPHYRAVLAQIPYAGEHDDVADLLPLYGSPQALPPPSTRGCMVLARYERHRKPVNEAGVVLGKARLAFQADNCVRCGLCMTGCPYELIYSTQSTFTSLVASRRVEYRRGLMALKLDEDWSGPTVLVKDIANGRLERLSADRIYVACGAVGTTRLVANSLELFNRDLTLQDSAAFTIPLISTRATPDPRTESTFTLGQFNILARMDIKGRDIVQMHCYTYNPAFSDGMPGFLKKSWASPVAEQMLRRTSFGIGYLPSWASPSLHVRVEPPGAEDQLPPMHIWRDAPEWRSNRLLRSFFGRLVRVARHLDLWPALPMLSLPVGGKGYHSGGSFRHDETASSSADRTDRLGRVDRWSRIHLVDGSVIPSVAATTFTLTLMANAHRIGVESLDLPWERS